MISGAEEAESPLGGRLCERKRDTARFEELGRRRGFERVDLES